METIPFTEIGVAGTAVVVMLYIVKAFLNHLSVKDKDFTTIIGNHMDHSTKTNEELIHVIKSNTGVGKELKESHEKLVHILDKFLDN